MTYEIDGERFSTLEEFFDEIGRVFIPGADWGRNLDAFNDILRGGFGTPTRDSTVASLRAGRVWPTAAERCTRSGASAMTVTAQPARAALLVTLLLSASCSSVPQGSVAVRIGGEDDLDACGSWAVARSPDLTKGKAVEVRGGPGPDFAVVDTVAAGHTVIVCDQARDGRWTGVVYPADGVDAATCGVSSPIAERQPYRGPCKSGWLRSDAVEGVAG